jgi:acylphosphatase
MGRVLIAHDQYAAGFSRDEGDASANLSCSDFQAAPIFRPDVSEVDMQRRTVYFSGRVQGVGFRYTARNIAQQYNVAGYVRNLADGRVELVLEGADEDMDCVVEAIRDRLDPFIGKMDVNLLPATGDLGMFQIRY